MGQRKQRIQQKGGKQVNQVNVLSARSINNSAIPEEEEQEDAYQSQSSANKKYMSQIRFNNYPQTYISFDEGVFSEGK